MFLRVKHRDDLPDWLALHVEYVEAAKKAACTYGLTINDFLPENWHARQAQILLHTGVYEDPKPPGGYRKPPD
jgi:hypothetical protein